MHQSSIDGVEDMIQLGDLSESGIMHNVQKRYNEKLIYVCHTNIIHIGCSISSVCFVF